MAKDEADDLLLRMQEERPAWDRARRLSELVREQDEASRTGRELSDEAQRSVVEFRRHADQLKDFVDAEFETLIPVGVALPDVLTIPVADDGLTHVFGASNFDLAWVHLDAGSHASAQADEAKISASAFTIGGPAQFTVAQIGARMRTSLPACKLSVSAFAHFSGTSTLRHRVHQPGSTEVRFAWALGSVGVKVDSVLPGVGDFHVDAEKWVDLWNRSEPNPSGPTRSHEGTVSSSDGLAADTIAIASREYSIWVTCRVGVSADHGFEVSTNSTTDIACHGIFVVVRELEHWS